VAGIIAALHTNHEVRTISENINDFPFTFVAPLGAN
jgi:hypothetical protein